MSFGMSETLLGNEETYIAVFFILVGTITLCISPNRFLQVLAVLGIVGSISFILFDHELYVYFHVLVAFIGVLLVYINLKEAHFISTGKWALQTFDAIRLGLMISFIQLSLFIGKKGLIPLEENQVWLSSLLLLPLLGFVLYSLLNRYQLAPNLKIIAILLSRIIMCLCLFAPAILASLLLVFIMFRVNYKIGFGIALIALVYSIAQYYYDLNLLLLHKSLVLMASGIFFMILFYIVHKKYTEHEQV